MSSLYIHIPFCLKKCSYCDFVSFEKCDNNIKHNYVKAVINEIDAINGEAFDTVFIGGGTPTALSHNLLCQIMNSIFRHGVKQDCEITVEANPETITDEYAMALKGMGVNRISLGLQSADDNILKAIGRIHSYDRFVHSYNSMRKAGFDNINVDLMYGLPNQTKDGFEATLKMLLELEPEHISAYSLILNDNTPMGANVSNGSVSLPDSADIECALSILDGIYHRYEVSNYCLPNKECRHNLNYWQNGYYYGVGCGAHGCLSVDMAKGIVKDFEGYEAIRTEHTCSLQGYIEGDIPKVTPISREESMFEAVMVGLRMIDGVSENEFVLRYNDSLYDRIKEYISLHGELILFEDGYIRLTKRGMDIQNSVLVDIMDYFQI